MMDKSSKFRFKAWAIQRDLDETRTHSAVRPPGLLKWLSKSPPKEMRLLNEPRGFFITDHFGTPMVFVLRGLISPELHVCFLFEFQPFHVSPLILFFSYTLPIRKRSSMSESSSASISGNRKL
jgi:hypothetical protein